MVFKELPIGVNSWRQHKNVFPLFPSNRGDRHIANMASFQAITPWSFSVVKLRDPPHCTVGKRQPQLRATPRITSGKLVYAAEWMGRKKQQQKQEAEKKLEEEFISERLREEVTWWKKMGTGLRSGTARFLTGSLPSAPWEVRFSALQTHEGHHLLQLKGQPLFPGCIVLLQCTHNLPAWPWKRHTTLLLKALNITGL